MARAVAVGPVQRAGTGQYVQLFSFENTTSEITDQVTWISPISGNATQFGAARTTAVQAKSVALGIGALAQSDVAT